MIEDSLKDAVTSWLQKVYKRFKEMLDPILKAYEEENDEIMANEL